MDYQFVCVLQFAIALLWICFYSVNGIIGRDLVLTPKQGLQLNGKSIYYEEESSEVLRNQSEARRPWERTLKHVTFVTLFTDAAAGAVAGNVSQLKEYNDFLRTPYLIQRGAIDARFGDIVTLAAGRLEEADEREHEQDPDNAAASYRFIEGVCDYSCAEGRVLALWQVQKIRHHDATNRKFRYEIKFSISPLGRWETSSSAVGGGGATKRWTDETAVLERRENSLQTFIQKEDDYPQSFGRIIYPDEGEQMSAEKPNNFAERRHDDEFAAGRNFRQVSPEQHAYRQQQATGTPVPQATFMRGIFQAPPPPPERLNIGEHYIKTYEAPSTVVIASPKLELYPNLQNTASRHGAAAVAPAYPHYAHTPTTYRPNYQVKFARPEFYHPPPPLPHELMRYPPPPSSVEHTSSAAASAAEHLAAADGGKVGMPHVTHHFHHHFYMPGSSSVENGLGGSNEQTSANGYKQAAAEVKLPPPSQSQMPPYYSKYGGSGYGEPQLSPAPQKFVFPVPSSLHEASPLEDEEAANGLQLQQHTVVHVTPPPAVPPLRRPQIYHMYHHPPPPLPLLIYPAPVDEVAEPHYDITSPRNKPFRQSEPLDEHNVRYSEPDPLYFPNASNAPSRHAGGELQSYELSAPQLEAPARIKIVAGTSQYVVEEYSPKTPTDNSSSGKGPSSVSHPPDSIVAQLPPPDKDQDVRIPYVDEDEHDKEEPETAPANKSAKQQDLEQKPSVKDLTISTEKSTAATNAEADDTPPQSATVTPTTTPSPTQAIIADNNTLEIPTTSTTASYSSSFSSSSSGTLSASSSVSNSKLKYRNSIVSTSTTESPLRAVSRHRGSSGGGGGGYVPPRITSSTTEAPVLKWKPRRRANYTSKFTTSNSTFLKSKTASEDSGAKSSERHEKKLAATTAMPQNATAAPATPSPLLMQSEVDEIFEVLTQKSVSKSVSIKVGSKGEEIPFIIDDENDNEQLTGKVKQYDENVDDDENEVKRD